jgi:hypothetical protein
MSKRENLREPAIYEFLEETVLDNMTSPAKTVAPEMTIGDAPAVRCR